MAQLNFVFDIFIKSFKSPKLKTEDSKKLQVEAKFNNNKVPITASRINVDDFNPNTSTYFKDKAEKLRENLEDCGMVFTVKFSGRTLGTGKIEFPAKFIDGIKDDMTDVIHEDSCSIEKDNEEVGTLKFKCRIVIKCDDPTEGECRRNMDKSINPQDIMFVLGESQKCPQPSDACLDALEPEEGDQRLDLDLQRYRGTDLPNSAAIAAPASAAITSQLKQMAKECEETIDSILKGADSPMQLPSMQQELEMYNQISDNKPTNSDIDRTKEDDNSTGIKPIRSCPVCLNNMSWLPKFAACPKCGAKPMPVAEKLKEKPPTADEILMEYLGKPNPTIEETCEEWTSKCKTEDKVVQCQCTCKGGKLCAHCRVRKACKDVLKLSSEYDLEAKSGRDRTSKNARKSKAKRETEAGSALESNGESNTLGSEDYPVEMPADDERNTHLARVFSELCFLYKVKKSNSISQIQRICPNIKGKKVEEQKKPSSANKSSVANKSQKIESNKGKTNDQNKRSSKKDSSTLKRNSNTSTISLSSKDETDKDENSEEKERPLVPRRLGWDWRTDPASKLGWRPGAIRKPIKKIMNFFKQDSPEVNTAKIIKEIEAAKEREKKPMLHVCKKQGEIFITLRSVDSDKEEKPIVYKVLKSDQAVRLSEMKRKFKDDGFRKCTCHKSVMLCLCRTSAEKRTLEAALEEECTARGIPSCPDELILTDTSESDMEYDFEVSPLDGAPKSSPEMGINQGTQTAKEDLNIKPLWPKEQNPYLMPYNCATHLTYTGPRGYDEDDVEEGGTGNRNGNQNGNRSGNRKGNRNGNQYGNGGRGGNRGNTPGRGNSNYIGNGNGFGNIGNNNMFGNGGNNMFGNGNNNANFSGNNNSGRGNGNKSGSGKNNSKGNFKGRNKGRSSGGDNAPPPVALPKRLQKDPQAIDKAKNEEKKQQDKEKQKMLMNKFMAMTKQPSIDRRKMIRGLLNVMSPPLESLPRRARAVCDCNYNSCYDSCYNLCAPKCVPCYHYCCC